jgi:hypothetical protein
LGECNAWQLGISAPSSRGVKQVVDVSRTRASILAPAINALDRSRRGGSQHLVTLIRKTSEPEGFHKPGPYPTGPSQKMQV